MPAVLKAVTEICVFILAGHRDRAFIGLCAAVNLMTNLALNLILSLTGWGYAGIAVLEILVVATEYVCYAAAVGRSGKLLGLTFAANLASFLIGVILFW